MSRTFESTTGITGKACHSSGPLVTVPVVEVDGGVNVVCVDDVAEVTDVAAWVTDAIRVFVEVGDAPYLGVGIS